MKKIFKLTLAVFIVLMVFHLLLAAKTVPAKYRAAEEAKKRAGIEKESAGSDLTATRDGTTVGKDDINSWWFGADQWVGKTYAEMKQMEADGKFSGNSQREREARAWIQKVEDDYILTK